MGNIVEAKVALTKALKMSKYSQIHASVGLSLVMVGYLRIIQSKDGHNVNNVANRTRFLKRALRTLKNAISIEGIEEEMRAEGKILIGQIFLLLGNYEEAQQQLKLVIDDVKQLKLVPLAVRARHLLSNVYWAQGDFVEAKRNYEQSLQEAKCCEMRLEMARILQHFGAFLLCNDEEILMAQTYLKEAQQIFEDCGAEFDMRLAKEEHEIQNMFVNNKTS